MIDHRKRGRTSNVNEWSLNFCLEQSTRFQDSGFTFFTITESFGWFFIRIFEYFTRRCLLEPVRMKSVEKFDAIFHRSSRFYISNLICRKSRVSRFSRSPRNSIMKNQSLKDNVSVEGWSNGRKFVSKFSWIYKLCSWSDSGDRKCSMFKEMNFRWE